MRRETVIAVWWVHGEGATSASLFWLSMTRIFAKTSSKSGRRTLDARGARRPPAHERGRRGLLSVAFLVSGSRGSRQGFEDREVDSSTSL